MSEYAPTPWKVRELTCEDHRGMGWIEDANGNDVICYGEMRRSTEDNRAIGRETVAAVNACKGLPIDMLEQVGPEIMPARVRYQLLQQYLGDLLDAAESAQCGCTVAERESGHQFECWMPALLEAIAKARSA